MTANQTKRTIAFSDEDETFVKQLAGDIGCRYSRSNERTFILNKHESEVQSKKGVFAWVHKESTNDFWVSTRTTWMEQARLKALSGRDKSNISCFSRSMTQGEDSICLDTKDDYRKTVTVLSLICDSR